MNFRWARRLLALIGLITLIIYSHPTAAGAQTASFTMTPPRTVISTVAGGSETITITLKNTKTDKHDFDVSFENFTSDGESGSPVLNNDANFKSGIKTWLTGSTSLSLTGNATKEYKATIKVPKGTNDGTYYGMVLFTHATDKNIPAVASLVFVNVGTVTESIEFESLKLDSVSYGDDGTSIYNFAINLKNTGNGYTVPVIKLEILDSSNKVVGTMDYENSDGILPLTTRSIGIQYTGKIDETKTHRAVVTITAGGETIKEEAEFYTPANTNQEVPAGANKQINTLPIILGSSALFLVAAGAVFVHHLKMRRPTAPSPEILAGLSPTPPVQPPTPPSEPEPSPVPTPIQEPETAPVAPGTIIGSTPPEAEAPGPPSDDDILKPD